MNLSDARDASRAPLRFSAPKNTLVLAKTFELLPWVVGFYFSARTAITLFAVYVLGADAATGAVLTLVLEILLLAAAIFCSGGAARHSFRSMAKLPSVRWVLLYLGFAGCSLAWSLSISIPTSAAYWCGLAADVAIVFLLLRDGSVAGMSQSLMKGFIVSTCCLAVVAWLMPAQADMRLGDEDYFNTNQIGNLCAFAIFFAQYLMRRKDGRWGLAVLFLVITLLRSLSKTTLVAFAISQVFLVIQDRSMSRRTKVLLSIGAAIAIVAFWGLFEAYYDVYTTTGTGNEAETLTGRVGIWLYVLNTIPDHLWIGHGFDSMWKVIPPFGPDRFEARHAENDVLQQLYTYGVAGVLLLMGVYGSLLRQVRRLPLGPVRVVFLSMMLFIAVRGLAEAEPFDLLLPLWLIVVISMIAERAQLLEQKAALVSLYSKTG